MPRRPTTLPGSVQCPACWWDGALGAALLVDDGDPHYQCLLCGYAAEPVWLVGDVASHLAWDTELTEALQGRSEAARALIEALLHCVAGVNILHTKGIL